jgi:hypothetical protein
LERHLSQQEKVLTAYIGELDAPDDTGFSNKTSSAPTRELLIKDETGKLMEVSTRTGDKPSLADETLETLGYRRTSKWQSGSARVELIPVSKNTGWIIALVLLLGVVAYLAFSVVSAVGLNSPATATAPVEKPAPISSPAPDNDDKYKQTWTGGYSTTTCAEWNAMMTKQQRFAYSADVLTAARNKIDGGSGVAPDSLINRFTDDISDGCSSGIKGLTISDVAILAYSSSSRYLP